MGNIYDVGDKIRCTASFTDASNNLVDPTSLGFYLRNPNGTTSSYLYGVDGEVVKSSSGIYYVDVSPDIAGAWVYRFAGSGVAGQSAAENGFLIRNSYF